MQERVSLDQSSEFEVCYFCGEPIVKLKGKDSDSLCKHHLNGNHHDNRPGNKVPAHFGCNTAYHNTLRGLRSSISKEEHIRKVYGDNIICHFCGEPIVKLNGQCTDSFCEHHISYEPEVIVPAHKGHHISHHHKDKTVSVETREKIRRANLGENHPFYGKHRSEKIKQRMRDSQRRSWIKRKRKYGSAGRSPK